MDSDILVRLTRLRKELAADRHALSARMQEVDALEATWQRAGSLARPELILLAVNLHGWYTALETGLDRVARLLDQSVPDGPAWHVDLLSQMQIEIPGLRPNVIPPEATPALHELRKFRHFFRNAYVLHLDPERVRERAHDLHRVHAGVAAGLDRLDHHLDLVLRAE